MPTQKNERQIRTLMDPPHLDDSLRHLVPDRWWESLPAIKRVALKTYTPYMQLSLKQEKLSSQLDELYAQGFRAVEVYASPHGGHSFEGLDTKDCYRIDPEVGTMDDFRRMVRTVHNKGMAIISIDNLGYCSVNAPEFMKACDDIRTGRESEESRRFLWSDRKDAPPPAQGDAYFMTRPTHLPGAEPGTFYDSMKGEFWQYSERAGCYYWTKWAGVDDEGNEARLPQYNWGDEQFQKEVERIVRFWMDTGIDGMMIDAVNWYVNYTWELGHKCLTGVIASYGNTYIQPEGAGGFHEDPVPWITEGGYNSVHAYELGIWWEKGSDIIVEAIESGDPRPVEKALRNYHDRIVAAGGVVYKPLRGMFKFLGEARNDEGLVDHPEERNFSAALCALTGHMISYGETAPDNEEKWLLEIKRIHPALHNLSTRRQIPTNADDKYYAFLHSAIDNTERILAVFNFQSSGQNVVVDMSGIATSELIELRNGTAYPRTISLDVKLPAYGYRLFQVMPVD